MINSGWLNGGKGAVELATAVTKLCEKKSSVSYLYHLNDSVEKKITDIAVKAYGAKGVQYSPEAQQQLAAFTRFGWDKLPICMAKTPNSLSDNAKLLGRPRDFVLTVRELRIAAGAGFIVVLTGDVMTMPGLPKIPAALKMGIDEQGNTYGLF
ncbi:Formate--tetrahydrofolate ligase 1 [bioreactor metagenome]|uniref:formate--tetrahydrofolate ligase n=1 Tax=bioreactor metagenome TaxID=1076179 RepID=A0A645A4M4_9ZZZZ